MRALFETQRHRVTEIGDGKKKGKGWVEQESLAAGRKSISPCSLCLCVSNSRAVLGSFLKHRGTETQRLKEGMGRTKGKNSQDTLFSVFSVPLCFPSPSPPLSFKTIASIPFFLPSALLFREPPAFRSRRRPRRLALDHRPQSGQNQLPQ